MPFFKKKRKKSNRKRVAPTYEEYRTYRPEDSEIKIRQDPNAPDIFVSRDYRYTVLQESKFFVFLKTFPWKMLAVTLFIIMAGGVGSAYFQARLTIIRNDITRAERELRDYQAANFALNSQLQERFTHHEIERIASERLGMSYPDQSQVINIYVPPIGGVTLNTDEYVLPQHNYFWQDVGEFLRNIANRIFGG